MLVRPAQSRNASHSIIETPSGIIEDLQPNISLLKSFDKQQLFIETYEGLSTDTDMVVRLVQPPNAPQSISVTPSGITIPVRPVQPLNAELMITVTLFGITILVRPVQPLNAP